MVESLLRAAMQVKSHKICRSVVMFVMPLWIAGCNSFSAPMSTIGTVTEWGRDINYVYLVTTIIVSLVGIVVAALLCYVIWRFRERPGDTSIPEQVHGSTSLEILWTVIPTVLLIFIAIPTFKVIFKNHAVVQHAVASEALEVVVIGHQWWWEFQYPSLGITTANEIHLPEDTLIKFVITSADVIHSFWVPKFGGKVDSLPGVNNLMAFTTPKAVNDEGDYYQGQCMELCGLSHALMRFQAVVLKKDAWERWTKNYNTPPRVETKREERGKELFVSKGCAGCHAIHGTEAMSNIGPNLTSFGNRKMIAAGVYDNNEKDLARWIQHPGEVKPGSLMIDMGVTDTEVGDIIAYIRNSTRKDY